MKKLSETYKELGIDFTFPIVVKDKDGNETYFENSYGCCYRREYDKDGKVTYYENSDGLWYRYEYDKNGNQTYSENSDDYWERYERDANGNWTYFETSNGTKRGTSRSAKASIILDEEESIRFAEMLKAAPRKPTPEMQRAVQAYRDSGIELRKDKKRLDWLIDNNCEIYEPDTALLYCDCDRESIDEMMAQATR